MSIARTAALLAVLASAAAQAEPRTHRWLWKSRPDAAAVMRAAAEMRRLHEAADAPANDIPRVLRDATLAWIAFGVTPEREEQGILFLFPGLENFNECSTNEPRYDALVTACLLVMRDHFPPKVLEMASTASWDQWTGGRALYARVLGRDAADPGISSAAKTKQAIKYAAIGLAGILLLGWLRKKSKAIAGGT